MARIARKKLDRGKPGDSMIPTWNVVQRLPELVETSKKMVSCYQTILGVLL